METSQIKVELFRRAEITDNPKQKKWFMQQAKDARPVKCVPMRDVFTPEQLAFISQNYKATAKQCYKNASNLVSLIMHPFGFLFWKTEAVYVEGFVYSFGLAIEHAFVKVGDKYIDPTFELVFGNDVSQEEYASCIELTVDKMHKYQLETGYYGELYKYDYVCKYDPLYARFMRAHNPLKKPV